MRGAHQAAMKVINSVSHGCSRERVRIREKANFADDQIGMNGRNRLFVVKQRIRVYEQAMSPAAEREYFASDKAFRERREVCYYAAQPHGAFPFPREK